MTVMPLVPPTQGYALLKQKLKNHSAYLFAAVHKLPSLLHILPPLPTCCSMRLPSLPTWMLWHCSHCWHLCPYPHVPMSGRCGGFQKLFCTRWVHDSEAWHWHIPFPQRRRNVLEHIYINVKQAYEFCPRTNLKIFWSHLCSVDACFLNPM